MIMEKDPLNPNLQIGNRYHGYRIKRILSLSASATVFYELEHEATRARHVHLSRPDSENTFGVAFKTVPQDSTGVAHILEHTVLCGSRKFPVRDPFFSMLKRSLSTFMNAFTASDWTMYPFSTQNKKDFYNLLDVYLDAVFYPNLDELSFKQEGHRLELESAADADIKQLVFKGVVYNEMKGAMSSPDQILARSLLKALYPDTTYGNNSGGEPTDIPKLTYAQLKAFHSRHYHPSNAYFYTYGDLPLSDHLAFIHEKILNHFDRIDPGTDVPNQPRWKQPRSVRTTYPLSDAEDAAHKYQVCLGWLTADIRSTFEVLVLTLLEQILIGNSAAPLRKTLIDSQLGSALCDAAGYDADNRDTMFICGLKDVSEADAPQVEAIIFDVLNTLVQSGIDAQLIESAVHQIEFHRKEITNSPFPYGLKQLMLIAGTWFHHGDPVGKLQLDDDLAEIRSRMDQGGFFERQIQKYFLDNPHMVRFVLAPDSQKEQVDAQRETDALSQIHSSLDQTDLKKIVDDASQLQVRQETPEDISVLPTLVRGDIPPTVHRVAASDDFAEAPTTIYQQSTSGILYFNLVAGIGALPERLIPLVPFFCYALPKVGTAQRDYTDMVRRIDLYTGSLQLAAHARTRFDKNGNCLPYITLSSKCLYRNQLPMFSIVEELLSQFAFSALPRLKSLLLEYRAQMESMVVHNGHRLAISLAARNQSPARAMSEAFSGVHQLQTIKDLTADTDDSRLASLASDLTAIGQQLFTRANIESVVIAEEQALSEAVDSVQSCIQKLSAGEASIDSPVDPNAWATDVDGDRIREGWLTATAVSFVAQTFGAVRMHHEDAPALAVISKMLRSLFLHREIREKGGAYGGFALYNSEDGVFGFASYRDPHIVATLDAFKRAFDYIRSGEYRENDVDEAVLQVCADIDKPDSPGLAAQKAFFRRLVSLSDDERQQFKENLLSLTKKDIARTADRYFDYRHSPQSIAVVSNEAKLNAANQKLVPPLSLHRI